MGNLVAADELVAGGRCYFGNRWVEKLVLMFDGIGSLLWCWVDVRSSSLVQFLVPYAVLLQSSWGDAGCC